MVELTRSAARVAAGPRRLEGEGRWAEGLRCRHRALVADLVAGASSPSRPGRTAGEYVADVAARPGVAPAFAAAATSCSRRPGTAAPSRVPPRPSASRRSTPRCWRSGDGLVAPAAPSSPRALGVGLLGRPCSSVHGSTARPSTCGRCARSAPARSWPLLEDLGADVEPSVGSPIRTTTWPSCCPTASTRTRRNEVLTWAPRRHARGHGPRVVAHPAGDRPGRLARTRPSSGDLHDRAARRGGRRSGRRLRAALRHPAATSCLGSLDFAGRRRRRKGAGDVVAIGGRRLRHQPAARPRRQRRAGGGCSPPARGRRALRRTPLPAGGGDKTLYDLVSDGVRRARHPARHRLPRLRGWRAGSAGPCRSTNRSRSPGPSPVGAAGRRGGGGGRRTRGAPNPRSGGGTGRREGGGGATRQTGAGAAPNAPPRPPSAPGEASTHRRPGRGRVGREEVGKVVVGQEGTLSGLVTALLVGGHVLLEGVPGVAKTLLAKALAAVARPRLRRVQFTPDLMPADVTGTVIYTRATAGGGEFRFREGPVFTNLLLADEINRTPPKTQAALLEAMEERQVTIEGEARPAAASRSSSSSPRRTRSSTRAPTRCPRRSSTGSCSSSQVGYPTAEQEQEVLRRHDPGLDPHDVPPPGCTAGGQRRRPRRRPRPGPRRARRGAGARLHRRSWPGPPASRRR